MLFLLLLFLNPITGSDLSEMHVRKEDPLDVRTQHSPQASSLPFCSFSPSPMNATMILEDLLPRLQRNELSGETFGRTKSVKWRFSSRRGALEAAMDPATAAWARPLVDAWQENLRRQLDQFGTTTRSARRRSNADDNGGGADLFLLNGLSVPCGAEVSAHYDDTVVSDNTPLRVSVLYLALPKNNNDEGGQDTITGSSSSTLGKGFVKGFKGGQLHAFLGRGSALRGEAPVCAVQPAENTAVHFRGDLFHGITALDCDGRCIASGGETCERVSVVLEQYDLADRPMVLSIGVDGRQVELRFTDKDDDHDENHATNNNNNIDDHATKNSNVDGVFSETSEKDVEEARVSRLRRIASSFVAKHGLAIGGPSCSNSDTTTKTTEKSRKDSSSSSSNNKTQHAATATDGAGAVEGGKGGVCAEDMILDRMLKLVEARNEARNHHHHLSLLQQEPQSHEGLAATNLKSQTFQSDSDALPSSESTTSSPLLLLTTPTTTTIPTTTTMTTTTTITAVAPEELTQTLNLSSCSKSCAAAHTILTTTIVDTMGCDASSDLLSVEVKRSNLNKILKGVGLGVFASRPLPAGAIVCEMRGHYVLRPSPSSSSSSSEVQSSADETERSSSGGVFSGSENKKTPPSPVGISTDDNESKGEGRDDDCRALENAWDRTVVTRHGTLLEQGMCSLINDCRRMMIQEVRSPLENDDDDDDDGGKRELPGSNNEDAKCWDGYSWNTKLLVEEKSGKPFVVATRDIAQGEELFYDYGNGYWDHWEWRQNKKVSKEESPTPVPKRETTATSAATGSHRPEGPSVPVEAKALAASSSCCCTPSDDSDLEEDSCQADEGGSKNLWGCDSTSDTADLQVLEKESGSGGVVPLRSVSAGTMLCEMRGHYASTSTADGDNGHNDHHEENGPEKDAATSRRESLASTPARLKVNEKKIDTPFGVLALNPFGVCTMVRTACKTKSEASDHVPGDSSSVTGGLFFPLGCASGVPPNVNLFMDEKSRKVFVVASVEIQVAEELVLPPE